MKQAIVSFFKRVFIAEKKYKIFSYASLLFLMVVTRNLRDENLNLKVAVKALEITQKNLKDNVVAYNRSFKYFPFPVWEKKKVGSKFVGQYFNPEYIRRFGHIFNYDIYNLIGKTNFQLGYPTELAQSYYENDIAVSVYGRPLRTLERYPDTNGVYRRIKVIKWRDIHEGDTLIKGMIYEFLDDE